MEISGEPEIVPIRPRELKRRLAARCRFFAGFPRYADRAKIDHARQSLTLGCLRRVSSCSDELWNRLTIFYRERPTMRVSTASTGLAARCGAASPSLRALCRPAAAPPRAASAAACVASSRHLPISSALLALLLRVQRAALLLGQLHGALDAPTRLECAEPTRECRLGACSRCARSSLVSGQGQGWGQWSGSGLESGVGLGLARWTSSGSARGAMPGCCTAATAASTAAPQRSARFEGICQPILGPAGGRLGNPAGSCV